VDILGTKPVLWAVFHEAAAGVDHEYAPAGVSVLFVDDNDAGGDAGTVKQVRGQSDDALDVAPANQCSADVGLSVAPEQHAVRQDAGAVAGAFQRSDDVQQVCVIALLARRRAEGLEPVVGIIQRIDARTPPLV
jgi:hypothetical protein